MARRQDDEWAGQLWMEKGHWALLAEHHPDRCVLLLLACACPVLSLMVRVAMGGHGALCLSNPIHRL